MGKYLVGLASDNAISQDFSMTGIAAGERVENFLLEWTTTPPTVEGWYWAYDTKDSESGVYMLRVAPDGIGDFLVGWDADVPTSLTSYTHWLGPLPVPEAPKGNE